MYPLMLNVLQVLAPSFGITPKGGLGRLLLLSSSEVLALFRAAIKHLSASLSRLLESLTIFAHRKESGPLANALLSSRDCVILDAIVCC